MVIIVEGSGNTDGQSVVPPAATSLVLAPDPAEPTDQVHRSVMGDGFWHAASLLHRETTTAARSLHRTNVYAWERGRWRA